MRRIVLKALLATAVALAASSLPAAAKAADATATYQLQNLSFQDGARAAGNFVFDYSTQRLASWSISVTSTFFSGSFIPGQAFSSAFAGDSAQYFVPATSGFELFHSVNSLSLAFTGAGLQSAPPLVALGSGSSEIVRLPLFDIGTPLLLSQNPTALRVALAVPEPSVLLLMLAGAVVVGVSIGRRGGP